MDPQYTQYTQYTQVSDDNQQKLESIYDALKTNTSLINSQTILTESEQPALFVKINDPLVSIYVWYIVDVVRGAYYCVDLMNNTEGIQNEYDNVSEFTTERDVIDFITNVGSYFQFLNAPQDDDDGWEYARTESDDSGWDDERPDSP